NLPIEVFDLIPRHVLPVFRELDAESVIGAFVKARDETLNHEPGHELHVCELCDDVRLKVLPVIEECFGHLEVGPGSFVELFPAIEAVSVPIWDPGSFPSVSSSNFAEEASSWVGYLCRKVS